MQIIILAVCKWYAHFKSVAHNLDRPVKGSNLLKIEVKKDLNKVNYEITSKSYTGLCPTALPDDCKHRSTFSVVQEIFTTTVELFLSSFWQLDSYEEYRLLPRTLSLGSCCYSCSHTTLHSLIVGLTQVLLRRARADSLWAQALLLICLSSFLICNFIHLAVCVTLRLQVDLY